MRREASSIVTRFCIGAVAFAMALPLALAQSDKPGEFRPPQGTIGLSSDPVDAAKASAYKPPLTADGHPDLEGIWQPRTSAAAYSVLPHPTGFFLGPASEGIVEGGELPYQPWAAEQVKYRLQHMELDPTGHCHFEGIPHAMYFPFQIFQTPQQIALVHENMHAYRIIYMDGRPHPANYSAWMGDSRGHWEGNTLVVDVAGQNDKSVFDMAGHFHSDALHVVERFTRIADDTISYEATLDDAKVFTRPFKLKFSMKKAPPDFVILESGCFEGERDQVHFKEGTATVPVEHYEKK
jgi:hypothetical protein